MGEDTNHRGHLIPGYSFRFPNPTDVTKRQLHFIDDSISRRRIAFMRD